MYTNADCTLYRYSKEGKAEKYTRIPVENVYWEDVKQSTFLKTGQRGSCTALVVIPLDSLGGEQKFTDGKDLIVKGIVDDEIDCGSQETLAGSLAALKAERHYLTVMSVDERLYGSVAVQHYELSCK